MTRATRLRRHTINQRYYDPAADAMTSSANALLLLDWFPKTAKSFGTKPGGLMRSIEYTRARVFRVDRAGFMINHGLVRLDGRVLTIPPRRWVHLAQYARLWLYPVNMFPWYLYDGYTQYAHTQIGPDISTVVPGLPPLLHPRDDPAVSSELLQRLHRSPEQAWGLSLWGGV
jgi:hypothetical protein